MSAAIFQIAIVSETEQLQLTDVVRVSAAIQKQATRDFGPIWEVSATVDAFDSIEDVPLGYWPIIIRDDIDVGSLALGYHANNGQPFALVQFRPGWELTASHECLEMLADPSGQLTQSGFSIQKDLEGHQVDYLVEVCDPCQDIKFAYPVNDVFLSDFCTPEYYGIAGATGTRLSFGGEITQPHQVLEGGYVSFHDSTSNHWFRAENVKGDVTIIDLGEIQPTNNVLRTVIDYWARQAANERRGKNLRQKRGARGRLRPAPVPPINLEAIAEARRNRGKRIHASIDKLIRRRQFP